MTLVNLSAYSQLKILNIRNLTKLSEFYQRPIPPTNYFTTFVRWIINIQDEIF